jgi:hypothetical protein
MRTTVTRRAAGGFVVADSSHLGYLLDGMAIQDVATCGQLVLQTDYQCLQLLPAHRVQLPPPQQRIRQEPLLARPESLIFHPQTPVVLQQLTNVPKLLDRVGKLLIRLHRQNSFRQHVHKVVERLELAVYELEYALPLRNAAGWPNARVWGSGSGGGAGSLRFAPLVVAPARSYFFMLLSVGRR